MIPFMSLKQKAKPVTRIFKVHNVTRFLLKRNTSYGCYSLKSILQPWTKYLRQTVVFK